MNTFACIKCGTQYEEKDVEAYYCPSCLVEKNRIAKEVDAKIAQKPKKKVIGYQHWEDLAKQKGGFRGNNQNGSVFLNANDIMV